MVRFGVRRAQTLGGSTFSLPTQNTLIHTRKLQLPFPIHPPAILFYFSGAFLKTHLSTRKRVLSSVKPDQAKQQQTNSHAEERERSQEPESVQVLGPNVGKLSRHDIVCVAKPIVVIILSQQSAWRAPEGCSSPKESASKTT